MQFEISQENQTSSIDLVFLWYILSMKFPIGIDEVGRGPIAGPVTVCAFIFYKKASFPKTLPKLKDSKKLSPAQRELWFAQIKTWQKEGIADFKVSSVSAKMIDKIGIVPAIQKALNFSLHTLSPKTQNMILLDGGLKAPAEYKKQKTIIKGDEKEQVISLASIVAKVIRDRYMQKMTKKYPEYGFETNVGYGTKKHYDAIAIQGVTPLHRRSFLKNTVK